MSSTALTVPLRVTPGIDVSHHQGNVNWRAVAEAGISFAFVKATDGGTFTDPQFGTNWIGVKDAGIIRGAYHFFRPAKPVDSQVENFVRTVREIGDGDLPPVLDLEEAPTPHGDEWEDVSGEQRVPLVLTWLEAVEARLGQKPIIYTRRGFVTLELPNPLPSPNTCYGLRILRASLRPLFRVSGRHGPSGSIRMGVRSTVSSVMWTLIGSTARRVTWRLWPEPGLHLGS